jgi:hypothetical protein
MTTPRPPRVIHLFNQDIHVYYWDHAKGTIEIPQVPKGSHFGVFVSDAARGEPPDEAVERARVEELIERLIPLKPRSVTFMGHRAEYYHDLMDAILVGDGTSDYSTGDYVCLTMWETGDPSRDFLRLIREFIIVTYSPPGHNVLLML